MSIVDFSANFKIHSQKFTNIYELVTYTHRNKFTSQLNQCIKEKSVVSFSTNFSYDNTDVEDIPNTFDITMQFLQDDEIIIIAEVVCPLSHDSAKEYFSIINTYSAISRKLQKSEYVLDKKNVQLKDINKELEHLANYDCLTNMYNRRRIFEELDKEYSRFQRLETIFSIAMIDIDHFKNINDSYGHQGGDIVLQTLSENLKSMCREYDSIGRFGGEEFLLILPGTNLEDAKSLLNRMLEKIANTEIELHENKKINITFSAGVSQITPKDTTDTIVASADEQLYQAKETGRNRVC